MAVTITARDSKITGAMKHYGREKAEKLYRYFDGITKLELTLGLEGSEHRAEFKLFLAKGEPMIFHEDNESMKAAIDLAVDHATRGIVKHKEKIRDHHRGEAPTPPPAREPEEKLESYQEVIERTEFTS